MLAMITGHRDELIEDEALIASAPDRYRPTIASTNSDRIAMLIRLAIHPPNRDDT
ncbi:hypothetical protein [Mesorhizobium sp.]|uniref:hypothetical protein n=1 Tax=Mesorhizobium sp. TaxID=1871066 RepID=UPI0025CFF1D5|nr:hypothetical protein [Mesorhizobium sp.]